MGRGWLSRSTLLIAALLLPACGSSSQPAKAAHAEGAVSQLHVLVRVPGNSVSGLAHEYEAALSRAGMLIVESEEEADIDAELSVSVRQESKFIKVYVDGQERLNKIAHVSLSLRGANGPLGSAVVEYDYGAAIPAAQLRTLVAAIVDSETIRRHAASAVASRQASQRAADEEHRVAWEVADAKSCADEGGEEACVGVREYLDKYPGGEFVSRAKGALKRGKAAVRRAKKQARKDAAAADREAWAAADIESCRKPERTDACEGVQSYLVEFPEGKHARTAQVIVDGAASKLTDLFDDAEWAEAGAGECKSKVTAASCVGVEGYLAKYSHGLHVQEAESLLAGASAARERSQRRVAQKVASGNCRASCASQCGGKGTGCANACVELKCKGGR